MIEKMIVHYQEFIKKYGFFPVGFILSRDVYADFKKEVRTMYPNDAVQEFTTFMGLPICVCSYDCGISFQVAPTNMGRL